jgi:uncharacterized protein YgiM (DUF1202 family)
LPISRHKEERQAGKGFQTRWVMALLPLLLVSVSLLNGCSRFKAALPGKYVYVTAKTAFLRDRIAAVSNRTANVTNGQRLKVLETNRRFYKVQTEANEVGWIDERTVATQQVADEFEALKKDHASDVPVATATVRDDVYLHSAPGRDTDRFYRLDEGEKLKLLARASTQKPLPPGVTPEKAAADAAKVAPRKKGMPAAAPDAPYVPPMEDWWLIRDSKGNTGWMLSRMMDTEVPDSIARYAEGQRIVAAYVLTVIQDPEMEGPVKDVPIYVTAMSPYKAGLQYDFDQLRVFTWNLKKHRYETALRDRNLAGYLPIKLKTDPGGLNGRQMVGPAPAFTYTVLAAGASLPVADKATGLFKPSQLVSKTYRLEGNITRRVLAPGTTAPAEFHLVAEEKKEKKGGKKKR